MKLFFAPCLALLASTALGVTIGETFDQLIAEKGKPSSQMTAGVVHLVTYPDMTVKLKNEAVIAITPRTNSLPADRPAETLTVPVTLEAKIAAANHAENNAITIVERIVNQPIQTVPRTKGLRFANFGPIWFQPGAITPDFGKVDIRTSQETHQYDKFEYVSCDLNPDVVFVGSDLEFNPMTKLFYTDRTLPKKRLNEREMLEINRQYRIIQQSRETLAQLKAPSS